MPGPPPPTVYLWVEARPWGADGQQDLGQHPASHSLAHRCAHRQKPCALETTWFCPVCRRRVTTHPGVHLEERLSTCPPLSLAHPYWLSGQLCWLPAHSHRHMPKMGGVSRGHGVQSKASPCSNTEVGTPRGGVGALETSQERGPRLGIQPSRIPCNPQDAPPDAAVSSGSRDGHPSHIDLPAQNLPSSFKLPSSLRSPSQGLHVQLFLDSSFPLPLHPCPLQQHIPAWSCSLASMGNHRDTLVGDSQPCTELFAVASAN